MQTYSQFRPTGFDPAGAFLDDDRRAWLVVPVSQTRDSGPLDRSNFTSALDMLGGESETVEVHRFGHWGPGWFEIIIVQPGSPAAEVAETIESKMGNYPVLDEQDYSNRTWEEFEDGWKDYGAKDLVRELVKQFELSAATESFLDDVDSDALREWWMNNAPEPYCDESSGVYIPIRRTVERLERKDVAALLRLLRAVPA